MGGSPISHRVHSSSSTRRDFRFPRYPPYIQETYRVFLPNRSTSLDGPTLLVPFSFRRQAFKARHLVPRCSISFLPFNRVPYQAFGSCKHEPTNDALISALVASFRPSKYARRSLRSPLGSRGLSGLRSCCLLATHPLAQI